MTVKCRLVKYHKAFFSQLSIGREPIKLNLPTWALLKSYLSNWNLNLDFVNR